jgi:ferredoxin
MTTVSISQTQDALAKAAALAAAAALPGPDPVPTVTYRSAGRTIVIGSGADVEPWAAQLAASLPLTVLLTDPRGAGGAEPVRPYQRHRGHKVRVGGWLGAFTVRWEEGDAEREAQCDLVLDLSARPLVAAHQPPPGYFAAGPDPLERADAVARLADMIGEFEKPKYFSYKERLCAHSRNRITGCNACIEICSAQAIEGAGERIRVNPNLCAGCGACTTVCPSGALSYAYPSAAYTGARLQRLLATYAEAGGAAPVLLFHDEQHGRALIGALEAAADDAIPANAIPIELQHIASVGIDVWLAAIAYGASGIMLLSTGADAPQYRSALAAQIEIAQLILTALGYQGRHLQLVTASEPAQLAAALARCPQGAVPAEAGAFHLMADKRNTLDLALSHLYRHAPQQPDQVALPAGAPFGALRIDTAACSLCMSCVGACPESALMDSPTTPQLRFVEKNCVQCGLCAATCPEQAIALTPRIAFGENWNKAVVLHESEPFCCIRCAKPFGTLQMIENMLGKLAQHPAFSGNLDRIKMCGDCRVVDMMQGSAGVTALARKRP